MYFYVENTEIWGKVKSPLDLPAGQNPKLKRLKLLNTPVQTTLH